MLCDKWYSSDKSGEKTLMYTYNFIHNTNVNNEKAFVHYKIHNEKELLKPGTYVYKDGVGNGDIVEIVFTYNGYHYDSFSNTSGSTMTLNITESNEDYIKGTFEAKINNASNLQNKRNFIITEGSFFLPLSKFNW